MLLETDRCIIRNMEPDDADALYGVLSDPAVMRHIEEPFTLRQTQVFIAEAGKGECPLVYALVYKEADAVIGHVIFHAYAEHEYEIGWIIGQAYWHRGIATEVTDALIAHAKQSGIETLVIECAPEQKTTAAIARRFGFAHAQSCQGREVYKLRL